MYFLRRDKFDIFCMTPMTFKGTFVIGLNWTCSKTKEIVCKFRQTRVYLQRGRKMTAPPIAPRYHAVWRSNLRQLHDG